MPQLLSFNPSSNSIPIDAAAVVLSNLAGTYGLRVLDTQQVLIAAGTAFAHIETGSYRLDVTTAMATVPAGTYVEYWIKSTINATDRYLYRTMVIKDTTDNVVTVTPATELLITPR